MSYRCANVGCGQRPTEGWLNFDNSMSVRLGPRWVRALHGLGLASQPSVALSYCARARHIRYANVSRRIPVPDGSLDALYSSHMLEHLGPREVSVFLREARRVLRPGGRIRLAVPDLKRLIERYCAEGDADAFLESLNMRPLDTATLRDKLRVLAVGYRAHRWMYDAPSLIRVLLASGYTGAEQMPPGRTKIPSPGRLDLREREDDSIYVEAVSAPKSLTNTSTG